MAVRRQRRAGSNALEFALVLPVLMTLVTGIVDYSWYMFQKATVLSAVEAGSRSASLVPIASAPNEGFQVAATILQNEGFTGGTVTSDLLPGTFYLQVTASMPFSPLIGLIPTPANINSALTVRLIP